MNSRQHDFQTNRDTHTALTTLYETISQGIYGKRKIDIVLWDLSNALRSGTRAFSTKLQT